ncbi:MAG: hypothetical protein Unbinned5350contig1001_42 [Prokaryotic dsDNA virus sp.]|nr:MAG: hypothetical protein Unbinned5350contig1001_42 [Prokaryotic dsDNA virus sp.]|tara:strand:- start:11794 stop:12003 length:210 start_codon:yes stop_codon:yes gene_type:complete
MNVSKNFKTIGEAMPNLSRRGCWMTCFGCDKQWDRIDTKYVHMLSVVLNGRMDSRFICDSCLKKTEKED